MPVFEHDSIRFHYQEQGQGHPFLFLHGLGGDADQPLQLFPGHSQCRVLSMDCRCHGRTEPVSPEQKLNFAAFAADAWALLDHLGIKKPILGGISMGAGIALAMAVQYPERTKGLVLVRPAFLYQAFPEHLQIFAYIGQLIWAYGAKEGKEIFRDFQGFKQIRAEYPATAESLLGQFDQPRAEAFVERLRRIPSQVPIEGKHSLQVLDNHSIPALILGNQQDPIHPFAYAEQLQQDVPGALLHEIPSKSVDPQGHQVRSAEFIGGFLQSLH